MRKDQMDRFWARLWVGTMVALSVFCVIFIYSSIERNKEIISLRKVNAQKNNRIMYLETVCDPGNLPTLKGSI